MNERSLLRAPQAKLSNLSNFQPSPPFSRILYLRDIRVSIPPEVEEFLIMLYSFVLLAFLLVNFAPHEEALGIDISKKTLPVVRDVILS